MTARLMVAGTGSGCGKTSVTIALLEALRRRGLTVSACKCGPDYIDPLFHREVLGAPSRNLDLFLCGEKAVKALLAESLAAGDMTVIEGVMGFYDGQGGTAAASSHELAAMTNTPVVLVADCRGKALSLAAEVKGYLEFLPNKIAGVILNRAAARSYPMLKAAVEEHCGLPVLGYLPRLPGAALESRHLGLVTAGEVENLRAKVDLLARQAAETVDLDALVALAEGAPPLVGGAMDIRPVVRGVRVAVAADAAFCFTYEDNLTLLERMGAEIVPFSPLADQAPEGVQGLILSGGYPELYAERLAQCRGFMEFCRDAVRRGMPVIAECGGFMVLCRTLAAGGKTYPMAGAVDAAVTMTGSLGRPFGYLAMAAGRDNPLCRKGGTLRAHEFHYSAADDPGGAFRAEKPDGRAWDCVHATDTLYAGYPHLHLWGNLPAAERFLTKCNIFGEASR